MQFVHNLRGLAILMILFGHAISVVPQPGSLLLFLGFLLGNGTLLFVAITGYLFAATQGGFRYLPYLANKARHILLPYLCMSVPAIAAALGRLRTDHNWVDMAWLHALPVWRQIGFLLLTGAHLGPFWFVPMILLYHLAAPLLLALRVPAILVAVLAASWAWALLAGVPEFHEKLAQDVLFYLPAFTLGYALHRFALIERWRGWPVGRVLIAAVAAIAAGFVAGIVPDGLYVDSAMLLLVPLIVPLFVACRRHLDRRDRWLDMFARLSFYLYFVHGYVTATMRALLRRVPLATGLPVDLHDLLLVTAAFAACVILSLLAYVPARLILDRRSRYVIGG